MLNKRRRAAAFSAISVLSIFVFFIKLNYDNPHIIPVRVREFSREQLVEMLFFSTAAALCILLLFVFKTYQLRSEARRRVLAEEKMRWIASHDEITALPNRRSMENRSINASCSKIMFSFEIQIFKGVDMLMGPQLVDEALRQMAQRLQGVFKNDDIFRTGDNRLSALLVRNFDSDVEQIANQAAVSLALPFRAHGVTMASKIFVGYRWRHR